MHGLWRDVQHGLRTLITSPSFTTVAMVTLALGVGAGAAIFSIIQSVLLDPAPYVDIERVVYLQVRDLTNPSARGRLTYQIPEFLEYQQQSTVFEDVIGGATEAILLRTSEGTERFLGSRVTGNTFRFLGVPPLLGRGILPSDAEPGAIPVFAMSHKMWTSRYNSDPSVIGRTYVLNNVAATCVGVMPPRFTKQGADIWQPVHLESAGSLDPRASFVFQGKLKPGVSLEQAAAELETIGGRVGQMYPTQYPRRYSVEVVSWLEMLVRDFRRALYMLLAAVFLLLLIACTNVANMLLARGLARDKEIAIRVALGASRLMLFRQFITESLLLAFGGAVLGCLIAYVTLDGISAIVPQDTIPSEVEVRMNLPVLLVSLAAGMTTVLIFGLVPTLRVITQNVTDPLKRTGRGLIGGFRRGRLRSGIVVAQIALSLVLLVGAGLLMRSFVALQTTELGFNPNDVFIARLVLPEEKYKSALSKQRFFSNLIPRLLGLPGVTAATVSTNIPPYGGINTELESPGTTHVEPWRGIYHLVSDGYFGTVERRLVRGQLLSSADVEKRRQVAVINQSMATWFFAGQDPIGRQIQIKHLETLPSQDAISNATFQIIGIVADAKNDGIIEAPQPEAFVPHTVSGAFWRSILVKTRNNPEAITSSIKREIWAVDPDAAMTFVGTLNRSLNQFSYAKPLFSLVLLSIFASVGLVLVAVGVYSTMSYTVSRQTGEIGVRMALGARRWQVLRLVLRQGLHLALLGVVAGAVGALFLTRLLVTFLHDVTPTDPLTFATVALLLMGVALVACYIPARRAARVDPLVALRYE